MAWVGMGAVVLMPMAQMDGLDRFVQLPQVMVLHGAAFLGVCVWLLSGRWRVSLPGLLALFCLLAEVVSVLVAQRPVVSILPIATTLAGTFFLLALLHGLNESGFVAVLCVACVVAGGLSLLGLLQFEGIAASWVLTSGLPSATLGHRNLAAAYIVGMLPLTGWCWWRTRSLYAVWGWGLVGGLELAFLISTRSRGAWVGLGAAFLLGLCVLFLFGRDPFLKKMGMPSRLGSVAVALILVVCVAFMPAHIEKGAGEAMWHGKAQLDQAVLSMVQTDGDKGRLALWGHTMEMVASHPVFGVGTGNWRLIYPAFAKGDMIDFKMVPRHPHSDILGIWSEMGTLGFVAYFFFITAVFWLGWQNLKGQQQKALQLGLLCGLGGVLVTGCFGFSRSFPGTWLPFYLCVVGTGVLQREKQRVLPGHKWILSGGLLVIGLSGYGVLQHVGFDKHVLVARIAFEQKQWPQVVAASQAALTFGTLDEEVYLMQGHVYESIGQYDRALAQYEQGNQFHPYSLGLWNGIGNSFRGLGKQKQAFDAYQQALSLDAQSPETLNNLGSLYAEMGQLDSARVAYEQAVTYGPTLVAAHANLSIVLRRQGNWQDAVKMAQQGLMYEPDNIEGLVAKGNALFAGGQFKASEQVFSSAFKMHPDRVELLFSLGRVFEAQSRLSDAVVAYDQFLKRWTGGDLPQVQVARSRLQFLTGQ